MCRIWVSGNRTLQKEMVFADSCTNATLNTNIQTDIPKFTAYLGSPGARLAVFLGTSASKT